ncbi:FkbM family methyltransferase [Pedobacter nanyangensis]|uniref:FkbM family methyltransferase n=1 Tax=Pedobacter nanyangensis TaxID=1562389 RepID=UPI000DE2BBAB|nr:FkbM family methyltransferase [Pedobacter nanyangensis]
MLKKLISKLLPNNVIDKIKFDLGVPNQQNCFEHLKKMGVSPRLVIDIGAYEGTWAIDFKKYFPNTKILMLEAQEGKSIYLNKVKEKSNQSIDFKIALLSDVIKEVEFNEYETASSVYKEDNETNAKVVRLKTQRLDDLLTNTEFEKPDFVKIDVQGAELDVLKGALNTLKSVEFVLIEVSFLNIYKGAPLAHEIVQFMAQQGFVIYDIASLMRRPFDKALNQSDFLFIKEKSPLRASSRWD